MARSRTSPPSPWHWRWRPGSCAVTGSPLRPERLTRRSPRPGGAAGHVGCPLEVGLWHGGMPGAAPVIRVVVVDHHRRVRAGLEQLLELTADIRVVGSAADGSTAVPLVAERRPDVVLMDISMPD